MSFCYISHSVEWKVLWLLTHQKRVQPILVGLVTPEIRISALKTSTSSTTFLVLSASMCVCKMQDTGLLWSFLSPGTGSIWYNEAQSHPFFTVPHSGWWLLSVYGYSWQPLPMCHYVPCRVRQLAISYDSATARCKLPANISPLVLELFKSTCMSVHQRSPCRACPRGAVSNMAPDRQGTLALFWLSLPRRCREDLIHLGMRGDINAFITDMWKGEGKCGS